MEAHKALKYCTKNDNKEILEQQFKFIKNEYDEYAKKYSEQVQNAYINFRNQFSSEEQVKWLNAETLEGEQKVEFARDSDRESKRLDEKLERESKSPEHLENLQMQGPAKEQELGLLRYNSLMDSIDMMEKDIAKIKKIESDRKIPKQDRVSLAQQRSRLEMQVKRYEVELDSLIKKYDLPKVSKKDRKIFSDIHEDYNKWLVEQRNKKENNTVRVESKIERKEKQDKNEVKKEAEKNFRKQYPGVPTADEIEQSPGFKHWQQAEMEREKSTIKSNIPSPTSTMGERVNPPKATTQTSPPNTAIETKTTNPTPEVHEKKVQKTESNQALDSGNEEMGRKLATSNTMLQQKNKGPQSLVQSSSKDATKTATNVEGVTLPKAANFSQTPKNQEKTTTPSIAKSAVTQPNKQQQLQKRENREGILKTPNFLLLALASIKANALGRLEKIKNRLQNKEPTPSNKARTVRVNGLIEKVKTQLVGVFKGIQSIKPPSLSLENMKKAITERIEKFQSKFTQLFSGKNKP